HFTIDASGDIKVANPSGLSGSYFLTVTATDNDMDPKSGSGTITVVVNTPPVAGIIPTQTVTEDSGPFTLALPPYFTDAEQASSTLSYSVAVLTNPSLLSGATVVGTDVVLTPAADANGSATIQVTATDSGG